MMLAHRPNTKNIFLNVKSKKRFSLNISVFVQERILNSADKVPSVFSEQLFHY